MKSYVSICKQAIILSLILTPSPALALFGQGTDQSNVGTDWSNTDKNISTTGSITGDDITATGKITPSSEGVLYNQGGANAVDTTVETKLSTQLVDISDWASLATAITDIGATPTTLNCTTTITIPDGTTPTLNANTTWRPLAGCTIQGVAGGGTETFKINGYVVESTAQWIGENLSLDMSDSPTTTMYAGNFYGTDIGAKVNAAIDNFAGPGRVIIDKSLWCGQTYSTMINVDYAIELVFPGIRNCQATYTGTDAAIKIDTIAGAKISGGVQVDQTGNVNANVDGLEVYKSSDFILEGGLNLSNIVRHGILVDSDGVGAYHNHFNGILRIDTVGGDNVRLTNSTPAANHPNANVFDHLVLNAPPASGQALNVLYGYSNVFRSVYVQTGGAGAWGIVDAAGPNTYEMVTIDSDMENGIKNTGTQNMAIYSIKNGASGTAYSETSTGNISKTTATANYWDIMSPNYYTMNTDYAAYMASNSAPTIYSSNGLGSFPFAVAGNLFIQPRTTAGSPRAIYLATGDTTPTARITVNPTGNWFTNENIGITNGDATPSLAGGNMFYTQNSGATTITNFDDMAIGQWAYVAIQDSHTTINFGATLLGNGGVPRVMVSGDGLWLIRRDLGKIQCFLSEGS